MKLTVDSRHMEDGCSKRFEVGMLETPTGGFDVNPAKGKQTDMPSVGAPLHPVMTVAPATTLDVGRSIAMDSSALPARVDAWR